MDVLEMMFREGRRKGLLRNVNTYVWEHKLNSHTHMRIHRLTHLLKKRDLREEHLFTSVKQSENFNPGLIKNQEN